MRWTLWSVALLAILIVALLPQPAQAEPRFWNGPDGWAYRVPLTINSTGVAGTNFQIPFNLATGSLVNLSKMRSDCADIRVARADGTTVPHWVESGCGSTAQVWIKAASLSATSATTYYLYYGNPSATNTSSVNLTFVANATRVEQSSCTASPIAMNCDIVNHTVAEFYRHLGPATGCALSRNRIDWGSPCHGTAGSTNSANYFAAEYRFLFVPDVSGTWQFEQSADNWSELATSPTDATLINLSVRRVAIAPSYVDHGSANVSFTQNVALTAGVGRWYSFVTVEETGNEASKIRLKRPGGSTLTLDQTNFPTMMFRRTYPSIQPFVSVGAEQALPSAALSVAAQSGLAQEVHVTWAAPSSTGGSPILGYQVRMSAGDETGPWTDLVANVSGTSALVTDLDDDAEYHFRVSAYTDRGLGAVSGAVTATTAAVPDEPSALTATPGMRQISLSWTAPASGSWPILNYVIWRDGDVLATIGANTSYVDATVGNNETRTYSVSAVSGVGEGGQSAGAVATTFDVPGAPQSFTATAGVRQASLNWIAGASNGATITGHAIFRDGSFLATIGANTSFVDATLGNAQSVTYQARALNAVGDGALSSSAGAVTPGLPGTPTGVSASGGIRQITVSWSAPSGNGVPIADYQVLRNGAPFATTATTTFVDTTLGNNAPASYAVYARSAVGNGSASATVSATTLPLPDAPTSLVATPGVRNIALQWNAAGPTIDNHQIIRDGQVLATIGANTSFVDATLGNGDARTYAVRAVDEVGQSAPSASATATTFDFPGAPIGLAATPGHHHAALAWSAPESTGGTPIANYRVHRDGAVLATIGTNTSFDDATLANGQTASYAVSAMNAVGEGQQSASAAATAFDVPSAPLSLTATGGVRQASLSWSAPSSSGGTPITGYEIFRGGAHLVTVGTELSHLDETLANGQSATYHVSALNLVGGSGLSNAASATAFGVPTAPQSLDATGGVRQIALTWAVPSSDGGTPITGYDILREGIPIASIGANTSYVDAGRPNNSTYDYRVRAVNAAGAGVESASDGATTFDVPGYPRDFSIARGNHTLTLTWTEPANNGAAITQYRVYEIVDGFPTLFGTSTTTSFQRTGLENGRSYFLQVKAVNAVGEGPGGAIEDERPATIPDPPQLDALARGNGKLWIDWSDGAAGGEDLNRTQIFLGTTPNPTTLVEEVFAWTHNRTLTGLTNGVTYYVRLTHTNVVGTSAYSNEKSGRPATAPHAPSGLAAEVTPSGVALNWTAPSFTGGEPIVGYRIYLGNRTPSPFHAEIGTNTSFLAVGLPVGVNHWADITAINAVGEGGHSQVAFFVPATVPGAPTGLVADPRDEGAALAWIPPASNGGRAILGYDLYARLDDGPMSLFEELGVQTTYTAIGLLNGAQYTFEVRARHELGAGPASGKAFVSPGAAPDAPTALTASMTSSDIHLTWASPDANGRPLLHYRLYAIDAPGATPWLVATMLPSANTYRDDVQGGTARTYALAAVNALGEGAASAEATGASVPDLGDLPTGETYRTCTRSTQTGTAVCTAGNMRVIEGLAAGGRHTCVKLDHDRVDCWGDDTSGQSGDHLSGAPAMLVRAGQAHTCVLLTTRNVDCYGNNAFGRASSYLGADAVDVAPGGSHTCFLRTDASVFCQGNNAYGQIAGRPGGVLAVAAGGFHSCYLMLDRHVECDGLNDRGQATPPPALANVDAIVANAAYSCAVRLDATIVCWGDIASPPPDVQGQVAMLAAGKAHVCAQLTSGRVACWGSDRDGQSAGWNVPEISYVVAGESHTCGLRAAQNDIVCWGSNTATDYGQGQPYPAPLAPVNVPDPLPTSRSPLLAAPWRNDE